MAQIYQVRQRPEKVSAVWETGAPGPSISQLQGGAMPTQEQLGHKVDLPGAIRAKMEASFGADLSGVEVYESQTVADAGAQAVTMGNKIGFAPGELDFTSSGGQALLGHELSHVVSQARGEVTGSGFLNDRVLEARADREGAMAAAGEAVYSGPVAPVSATSTALSAAGPMQAKKPWKKEKTDPIAKFSGEKDLEKKPKNFNAYHQAQLDKSDQWLDSLAPEEREAVTTYSSNAFTKINGKLRGTETFSPEEDASLDKTIQNTSAAIQQSKLETDTILHRGAGDGFIRFLLKNQMGVNGEELHRMGIQKNDVDELSPKKLQRVLMAKAQSDEVQQQAFYDPGFTSTSISKGVAADFATDHGFTDHGHLMEIRAPKGTPAAYIEKISKFKHEKEMLLDKGQKWRLRSVNSLAGEKIPGLEPGMNNGKKFDKSSMRLILELINEEEEGQRR